ncbi:MAG: LodA/GoxA family CTQ-dependent oxidase [Thermoanaerobaculia bacterium]
MHESEIVRCAVYPSVGCARVGNSPDEWFLGPEVPGRVAVPEGGFKDSRGRIKRQAARFRVYGYDRDGKIVAELNLDSAKSVEWTVHVANKKASWYNYNNALDLPAMAPPIPPQQRNINTLGAARKTLDIDPGPRAIQGREQKSGELTGHFLKVPVSLGELRTDEAGRLIFLGGIGRSASAVPSNPIENFSNNAEWFDDISDGWVKARVTLRDGTVLEAEPGWVFTGPPDFAPGITPLITMWDLMRSVAVEAGWLEAPKEPSFREDIWPLLHRLGQLQWVSESANLRYGWQSEFDFLNPKLVRDLGDPAEKYRPLREQIFFALRSPAYDKPGDPPVPYQSADLSEIKIRRGLPKQEWIPFLLGDGIDYPGSPMQWFAIPRFQYEMMRQWAEGNFKGDWVEPGEPAATIEQVPLAAQPETLTKAALEPVFGGAFHPGVELTWPMRHARLYSGAFRIRLGEGTDPDKDYGRLLTPEICLGPDGPLGPNYPGDLTRWMGLPWQSDAASCQSVYLPQDFPVPVWWPANLPVDVLPQAYYEILMDDRQPERVRTRFFESRQPWIRGVGGVGYHAAGGYTQGMIHMVNDWYKMGILVRKPGPGDRAVDVPPEIYVESQRGELEG